MSLQNASVLKGATLTTSGGTAESFVVAGQDISNGIILINTSNADARLWPSITCVNRPPTYNQTTDAWTKGKRTVKAVAPKVLANGKIGYPLIEARIEDFPEMTSAERIYLLSLMAQVLGVDADFSSFVQTGSLS